MQKIIIIGAGIAGLSAGIYGRINGFYTEIYEMHKLPGGECTGWLRGDYQFDGCIHWMMGTKPGSNLRKIWETVGALDDTVKVVNPKIFGRIEDRKRRVNIYRDVDLLEKHLLEISPRDAEAIREITGAIRDLTGMDIPTHKPMDMHNIFDKIAMGLKFRRALKHYQRYSEISVDQLVDQLHDPLVRRAFSSLVPFGSVTALNMLMMLASLSKGDSGYPLGGSFNVAKRMEEKYISFGGKVFYDSPVTEVLVENNRAVGVRLENGQEKYADYTISAADGHHTIFELLQAKYKDAKITRPYRDQESYPLQTTIQVSVGIDADLSHHPHCLEFAPSQPVNSGGKELKRVSLRHYCLDQSMAPPGKSVVTALLPADFDWWRERSEDKAIYDGEKERVAAQVITAISERFLEAKGKVEAVDVVTPMTYVRYCNAYRGAWMSWMPTPSGTVPYFPGKLPALEKFYMAGQWTMPPGGLPGAALAGKWVIQRLCTLERRRFITKK